MLKRVVNDGYPSVSERQFAIRCDKQSRRGRMREGLLGGRGTQRMQLFCFLRAKRVMAEVILEL